MGHIGCSPTQVITVHKGFYDKIYDKGFDYFDSTTSAAIYGTVPLFRQIGRLAGQANGLDVAWVGYLRFGEHERDNDRKTESSFEEATPPPFALLALWERVPWHKTDPAKRVSPQTRSFLKRAAYELSAGFYSWQSLLALEKAAAERKRLVADNVHGLKSCIHLALNETEIIDILLSKEKSPQSPSMLLSVMQSIRADLADFVHKIRMANLFTVLDRGRVSYAIDSLDSLSIIVNHCIHELEGAGNRRGIRFHIDDQLLSGVVVKCDPTALETAITALLDNAVKYSYPDRTIYIRLADLGTNISLEIEDFGKGILPHESERIFEPFYRSQIADYKQSVPGTGIGLTVCRDVITAHGGSVTVKRSYQGRDNYEGKSVSEVSGHNVIFEVVLPKGVK